MSIFINKSNSWKNTKRLSRLARTQESKRALARYLENQVYDGNIIRKFWLDR